MQFLKRFLVGAKVLPDNAQTRRLYIRGPITGTRDVQ